MTRKPLILALLGVLVVTTPGFTQVLLDPSVDPLAQGYQTLGTAPYQPGTFLAIDDASTADRRTFFKTIPEIATSAFAVETNIMIDSSFVLVDSSGDTGVRVILSDGMLQVAATLVQINNERRIALVRLNGTFTVGFLMDWTVFQTVHLERTADGRAILTVGSHREVLFPEELPLASRASPYLEFGAASSPAAVRVLFDAIRQVAPSNVPGPGTPPPLAGVRLPIMTLPSNQPVLTGARGVAVDRDGNIHVVLRENVPPAIVKLDATGREIWRIGSRCDASSGFGCADPDGSGPLQLGDGQFEQPMGLAVDGNGRVYVSDFSNMNIQVFDSDGRFLFKFGSFCGPDGFGCVDPDGTGPLEAGDGQFCNPAGIAVNGAGQIYVVDNCLSRIQVFDSTGRFLFKFGARGSGPGQFGFAGGLGNVAVDGADRVYVADDGNSRIQVFDPDGTFRFAFGAPGTGDGQFERPFGLAIDGAGSIYVTDFMKPRVQKFDALGRFVSSFGSKCLLTTGQGCVDPDGAGPLELGDGQFSGPASVATDAGGLVYVVDGGELANHRVEVFDSSGRFLTKLGAFSPSPGRFTFPRTVALDGADRIYVLDVAAAGTDRVQVFDTAGAPISAFGYRSQLGNVSDMTVDGPGTVYLADTFYNSRILKFDASGALGGNFGFFGAGTGFISAFGAARPERIRLDQAGNLYVQSASMVQKFDPSGRQLQRIAPVTTQFAFSTVSDVAVDGGGRVYVAESVMSATFPIIHSLKVQRFDPDGTQTVIFSVRPFFDSTVPAPLRIALDATDRLYVLSPSERRIRAFDPSGAALFTLGDGQFAFPQAIAIGVAGRIYVADGGSNQSMRIQVFDHGGTFLFTFGSFCRLDTSEGCVDLDGAGPLALGDGQFASIDHLTIDAAGRVYIVDGRYFPANARIQVFDPDGNFLFKFGSFCYLGQNVGCIDPDGTGPLAPGDGQFLLVIALTIDSAGQIYILDQNRDTQFLPVPRLQVFDGAGRFLFKLGSLCSLETNFGCIPPDGVYLREPGAAQFGAFGDSGGVFSESLGAVLVDGAGSIYVADTGNRRIVKFDQQFHPVLTPQFGYGSTVRIATDPAGNLYAADDSIPRIQKLDPDGNVLLRFGGPCNIERGEVCTDPDGDGPLASGDGQFNSPRAIATDSAGRVYVADGGAIENVRIQVFDPAAGTFLFKFGSFCSQTGFGCVDPDGSGPLQSGDGQFTDLVDLAVDGAGQIYLSDQGNGRILLFDATGRFVTKFARPGTRLGEFVYPDGIAVDRRGRIYVADNGASRVQVFGPASRDTTPPVVTAPSNQVAEATGSAGAVVNYPPASATDDVAVVSGPSCAPATGSSFAIGATEVTCTARDAAGNTGSASFMVTVRDTTPPTLTLPSALVTQATGGSAAVVTFSASAQDVVDGARAVTCAPTSGSSFTVGTTMVACSASDGRGNTARGSFTVTVGYAFTGFRQPVDNPPTVNVTKAGTAVPVKFSLRGNQGLAVFTSGSPSSSPAVCQTGAPLDTIDQTVTAGSTGLSYVATLDQYVYVWKTDKAWADTCRQLIVRFRDGTQYVANFRFTR